MTKTATGAPEVPHCHGQLALVPLPEGAIFDLPDRARMRSVQEIADLLGLSKDAVYGLIRDGSLTASKPAGKYRVAITDLEAFVRSTRVTPNEKAPARAASHAEAGEDNR